jgi:hypothetical protein
MTKKLILAGLLVGAMTASSAFAATVTLYDGPGTTGGGEFVAVTSANGNFITFCLEYNQHIGLKTPYSYTISNSAQSQGDPLSLATAWLYNEFLNGTLAGIDDSGVLSGLYVHENQDADYLQRAIWFLEGETGGVNNSYAQAALTATGLTVATKDASVANGAFGVWVMNIRNLDGSGDRQDQLIRVPDGGTTLALLGMSMGFVAFASRRMRS